MGNFLGVNWDGGETFHVDSESDFDPMDPMDKIRLERLALLHQMCHDFDDEQEERLP